MSSIFVGKRKLKRSLGLLLVAVMVFSTLSYGGVAVCASENSDAAEEIFRTFGEGETLNYTLSDSDSDGSYDRIVIGGTGRMPDWSFESSLPWYKYKETLKTVEIGGGIIHIGSRAFSGFYSIENLTISEGVSSIGELAFGSCSGITTVKLPVTIDRLEERAFSFCTSLSIQYPDHAILTGTSSAASLFLVLSAEAYNCGEEEYQYQGNGIHTKYCNRFSRTIGESETCIQDVNHVCVVCGTQSTNDSIEQDTAPLVVNHATGEAQSTFAIGETFHIKGSKKASAIQRAEVWYNGNQISSKEVSKSDNGVEYDISINTRDLNLAKADLNQPIRLIVRFVCSNMAEEEVEVETKVTAEAVIEKDGSVKYLAKLKEAFEQNSGDGDITLLSDVDAEGTFGAIYFIWASRTYSLDLNHHNIRITQGDAVFNFGQNTQLTIKGEGKIEFYADSGEIFYLQGNSTTLNIEGGEFLSNCSIISSNYKNNVNISGGTFTSTYTYLFHNAANSGNWTCLKDMPASGYFFVDEQDAVIEVGEQTIMYVENVGNKVTVRKADFERDAVVKLSYSEDIYNGASITPPVQKVSIGGVKLTEGTDYTVSYLDNIEAGDAAVMVNGMGNYSGSKKVNFTIIKATLQASGTGTATGIYGAKLSELAIGGLSVKDLWGQNVIGTWRISDDTIPSAGDTGPYTAVFIPDNGGNNYNPLTAEVTLAISKADGILTIPVTTVERIFSNTGFSLNCSTNGDGKISYVSDNESVAVVSADGTVTIKGVGTATITVSLAEGVNYTSDEEQLVTVNVVKAIAPDISSETRKYIYTTGSNGPVEINIADKLPENVGETKYTLAATDPNGILSDISVDSSGVLTYTVEENKVAGNTAAITVTVEMANYENVIFTVNIGISDKIDVELQAGSSVSINGSNSLIYGQTLSTLTWNPAVFVDQETKENVEGNLAWKEGSNMPDVGTISAEWIFTPTDYEKYAERKGTVPITVAKATPEIEVPVADAVTYNPSGTLGNVRLNGGSATCTVGGSTVSVEGAWSWKDALAVPAVGNSGYTAIFTPEDTTRYNIVECTVTVTVEKAVPHIVELPKAADIIYGDSLGDSILTGGTVWYSDLDNAEVVGSFAWKDGMIKPDVSDSQSTKYIVVFTPLDETNYSSVETEIVLMVEQTEQPKRPGRPVGSLVPPVATPTPDIPTVATPTPDIPTVATPTPDIPTVATPTPDIPTAVTPTPDIPTAVTLAPDIPTAVTPTPDIPSAVPPTPDIPTAVTPTPDIPTAATPTPDTPNQPTTTPSVAVSKAQQAKNVLAINAGLKASQTGNKITIAWGRVNGADGYDVYVQYCGKKFTTKSINSVNSGNMTKLTVKKVNGKKLNLKKNYRIYVLAYKRVDGKKVILGKSITAHIAGRKKTKYTNVKAVEVKKSAYSLKKGETAAIKASTVLVSRNKRQLSDAHAKEFRYATSDKKVAAVTAKGKIKAVGKGSCIIYVYARNGYAKKVKVEVK